MAGSAQIPGPGQDPPLPASAGLRRQRLLHVLDDVPDARLGLVIAPAGTGKTTLLADWARAAGLSVAWCRAARDDTAASLLHRVAGQWGLDGVAVRTPRDLVAALADSPAERVLVVDDVHVLPDGCARQALEVIAQAAPPATSLLIGSRRDPGLDLVHAEVSANPVVLGPEDLRFRSWEVESLFRDVYRAQLSPDDAAALARHTGGWAAALHLFHLSTCRQGATARHHAVQALAGRSRYARGYLSRQVLAGLDEKARTFLQRTCVFEVLTAARCDALLTRWDSQSILSGLVLVEALVTTDDAGVTFRCHEVLRSHLEADLESDLGDQGMRAWCARAADILEADGATVESLRVRARARDWAGVSSLVNRAGGELTSSGSTWTGLLPDSMLNDDPWIQLAVAQRLVSDGRLAAAADAVQACRHGVDDPRAEERIRSVLSVTRAWNQLDCPPSRRWFEQVAGAMRSTRLPPLGAAGRPDEDDLARPFLLLLQGRTSAAADATRYAAGLVGEHTPPALSLALIDGLTAWLHDDPGARTVADEASRAAEAAQMEWFVRASRALVAATDPDREHATTELRRVVSLCDTRGDPWGALWAAVLLALGQLQSQQPDADPVIEAAERARDRGATALQSWMAAFAALIAARTDVTTGQRLAREATAAAQEAGTIGALAVSRLAEAWASGGLTPISAAQAACVEGGVSYRPWERWDSTARPNASASSCPTISVHLLGGFSVWLDGGALDLQPLRPQARQLLRVLALHAGQPMHREQLAELMWPAQPARTAIHRLQVSVSSLRRAVCDNGAEHPRCTLVERYGESYMFPVSDSSAVDVLSFRRALDRAREARRTHRPDEEVAALQLAVDLYHGDLLPEDGPSDWVVEEREQLRGMASAAAADLADRLRSSDPRAAVAAAERSLSIDPLNDAAWQCLIALREDLGDLAQAERARASYQEVLRELGLEQAERSSLPQARV